MSKELGLILSNVLLALQLCLGVWQFTKLTPVGALIKGVVGFLLRPLGLSHIYSRLQYVLGRVFKHAILVVLQPEIPSGRIRRDVEEEDSRDPLHVNYLGEEFHLERRGSERHMLFINGEMRYYITHTIWKELQILHRDNFASDRGLLYLYRNWEVVDFMVLKGQREFWEGVSTGGVMTFEEVLDGLILHNQHLSAALTDHRLLPVDLSVSEEKLLKILNLFAVFLQTKKEKVHWLIPTSLSFLSALLEFSTPLRLWLYTNINVLFCSMMHFVCDPLPLSWRRQVYSLGSWVENLKPSNDIQLKIQRGSIPAIIAGPAKVNKEGATLVPWLDVVDGATIAGPAKVNKEGATLAPSLDVVEGAHSRLCNWISTDDHIFPGDDIFCVYYPSTNRTYISAPSFGEIFVQCGSGEEYRRLITFVSRMANNGCGSLKSCGPNNKASVRGFSESIFSYVKNGFPPVYELELENVVLT